jgi:hypothetical protein
VHICNTNIVLNTIYWQHTSLIFKWCRVWSRLSHLYFLGLRSSKKFAFCDRCMFSSIPACIYR